MSGGAALIGVSKYERSVGGYSGGGKRPAAARMPADPVRALAPTLNRNDRLESVIFISTGGGAPPPPRTDADTEPRRSRAAAQRGRRRFSTGGGAPPPPRTDADTEPRRSRAAAQRGRRRFSTGGGAPPPPRTDADAEPRRSRAAAHRGRR